MVLVEILNYLKQIKKKGKSLSAEIDFQKINPNIKSLYALLKKFNIEKIFLTKEFNIALMELNLDDTWRILEQFVIRKSRVAVFITGFTGYADETFKYLLNLIYLKAKPIFIQILNHIIITFHSSQNINNFNYKKLEQRLLECGFEKEEIIQMGCFKEKNDEIKIENLEKLEDWRDEIKIEQPEQIKLIFQTIIKDIEKNFRKIVKIKPQGERSVQDDLELFFDVKEYGFLREQEEVGFSVKSFKPDFTHEILNIALEVKFVNKPEKRKSVIDEMSADVMPYSKRWKNILFLIYDVGGNIRDIDSYAKDFFKDGEITIRCIVIKH